MAEQESLRAAIEAALQDPAASPSPAQRVCRVCSDSLAFADGVAFFLLTGEQSWHTLYASDETASALGEMEFTLGEGPCFAAFESGGPTLLPDVRETSAARWPAFAEAVQACAVGGCFALPLQFGAVRMGVMTVYRREAGALSVEQLGNVLAAADAAVWALLILQAPVNGTVLAPASWADGSVHHREVHQAAGMLMARLNVPAADALALLRAHSFVSGRLIGDVAADVVARRLLLGPGDR